MQKFVTFIWGWGACSKFQKTIDEKKHFKMHHKLIKLFNVNKNRYPCSCKNLSQKW